jgi:hypothetical protein
MGDGISPDGSRVLLSELDSKVKRHVHVIEVEGGRVVWSGEHSAGGDVTFLNDGNRVLSNELGPSLIYRLSLLDVDAGRPLWQVELEKGLSSPLLRVSQDGKFLLGWRDAKVPDPACVIDLETRQVVAILEESARLKMPQFQMVAGRAEVIGLLNGELVHWDAATGKVVRRVDVGGGGSGPDQHALSPEGSRFYLRHGNTITQAAGHGKNEFTAGHGRGGARGPDRASHVPGTVSRRKVWGRREEEGWGVDTQGGAFPLLSVVPSPGHPVTSRLTTATSAASRTITWLARTVAAGWSNLR